METDGARARAGAPLFAAHCAGCHGLDGRGAPATIRIPNLTTMAKRSGGTLEIRRLYEWIAGGNHDRAAMPEWDHAFREAGWPAGVTARNIEAIARYLVSIQVP